MIVEKYTYGIFQGEYEISITFLSEENGIYVTEFDRDPRLYPNAIAYCCNRPYFDTFEEAKEYIKSLVPSDNEINKVIAYLNSLPKEKLKALKERLDHEFNFAKKDCLDSMDDKLMDVLPRIIDPLRLLLKDFLVINGETVRISEIQSIKWGGDSINTFEHSMNTCEVIMRDGSRKKPDSLMECWLIYILFGQNFSDHLFLDIHWDFKSDWIHKYVKRNDCED